MGNGEKELIFHYIKTNNYKTFYSDGFFGGITPKGKIYMEPFIERGATPQQVKHIITEDGNIDEGTILEGKKDVIREIECGIIMDIETAKSLVNWLTNKIDEFQEMQKKLLSKEKH